MYYSYWGQIIDGLSGHTGDSDEAREDRQFYYKLIRKHSEFDFAGFGDDVQRWIAWLKNDDTIDDNEISRRYKVFLSRLSEEERQRFHYDL